MRALGLTNAKGVATPGTDYVGPRPVKSVNCAERQKGVILLKRSNRRMTFSLAVDPERGGEVQFPCYGQARPPVLSESIDAKNGLTTRLRCHCPQKSSPLHSQVSTNGLQISMDCIGQ